MGSKVGEVGLLQKRKIQGESFLIEYSRNKCME
jgi:hypothetical protein